MTIANESWQKAKQNSRYGHRTWICWTKDGEHHSAVATAETVKSAMLDVGVHGRFELAVGGTFMTFRTWRSMMTVYRNARANCLQG